MFSLLEFAANSIKDFAQWIGVPPKMKISVESRSVINVVSAKCNNSRVGDLYDILRVMRGELPSNYCANESVLFNCKVCACPLNHVMQLKDHLVGKRHAKNWLTFKTTKPSSRRHAVSKLLEEYRPRKKSYSKSSKIKMKLESDRSLKSRKTKLRLVESFKDERTQSSKTRSSRENGKRLVDAEIVVIEDSDMEMVPAVNDNEPCIVENSQANKATDDPAGNLAAPRENADLDEKRQSVVASEDEAQPPKERTGILATIDVSGTRHDKVSAEGDLRLGQHYQVLKGDGAPRGDEQAPPDNDQLPKGGAVGEVSGLIEGSRISRTVAVGSFRSELVPFVVREFVSVNAELKRVRASDDLNRLIVSTVDQVIAAEADRFATAGLEWCRFHLDSRRSGNVKEYIRKRLLAKKHAAGRQLFYPLFGE